MNNVLIHKFACDFRSHWMKWWNVDWMKSTTTALLVIHFGFRLYICAIAELYVFSVNDTTLHGMFMWSGKQNNKTKITFSFMHFNFEVSIFSFSLHPLLTPLSLSLLAVPMLMWPTFLCVLCANRMLCNGHLKTTSSSASRKTLANIVA